MKSEFITPAVTLFQEDGSPDYESLASLYRHLVKGGVSGALVLGSIGEFFAIPKETRKAIARFAVSQLKGKIKVLVGATSMFPGETAELCNHALECGADGVVVIPPYYFALPENTVYDFYASVAREVKGDLYLYNFPERTGYDISPTLMLRLASDFPNIMGCKDTLPGMAHTKEIIKLVKPIRPDFKVYSGFEDNFAFNILSGGDGCIGGLSNVLPGFFKEWMDDFARDDLQAVASKQQAIHRLMDFYAVGAPFVPYMKTALMELGVVASDRSTFPLPKPTREDAEKIMQILTRR